MFYVGQKVVALETKTERYNNAWTIVKGNIYFVRGVKYCTNCGKQSIDIGQITSSNNYICNGCKARIKTNGICWIDSKRFAPLQDIEADIEELCERILREVEIEEPLTV